MEKRQSDFAGSWYPGDQKECFQTIEAFAEDSLPCPCNERKAIGGIVPHAGWYYSGKIACNVIQCMKGSPSPDTIIIFGGHLHAGMGNFIMKNGSWSTPLGDLQIDNELSEKLANEFSFHIETPTDYVQDNTIELQLPFVKFFFPDTRIVPIRVPPVEDSIQIGERVAKISMELGRKVLILGSTDLTHYGSNYGYTPKGSGRDAVDWVKNENDRKIIDLMVKMDASEIVSESKRNQNTCCSGAVASAIGAVKMLGSVRCEELIYSTSYDIRPDNNFVGYAGMVFC